MRYLALCCDYDGTIAHHGLLDAAIVAALERFRASGRRLVLVTGRELGELKSICPHLDLFERVVAENGALLYRPDTREERVLGERPPDAFVAPATTASASSIPKAITTTSNPLWSLAVQSTCPLSKTARSSSASRARMQSSICWA